MRSPPGIYQFRCSIGRYAVMFREPINGKEIVEPVKVYHLKRLDGVNVFRCDLFVSDHCVNAPHMFRMNKFQNRR